MVSPHVPQNLPEPAVPQFGHCIAPASMARDKPRNATWTNRLIYGKGKDNNLIACRAYQEPNAKSNRSEARKAKHR